MSSKCPVALALQLKQIRIVLADLTCTHEAAIGILAENMTLNYQIELRCVLDDFDQEVWRRNVFLQLEWSRHSPFGFRTVHETEKTAVLMESSLRWEQEVGEILVLRALAL